MYKFLGLDYIIPVMFKQQAQTIFNIRASKILFQLKCSIMKHAGLKFSINRDKL